MKLNKFLLVSLILLAILTFGAVNAADNVAADDMAVADDGGSYEIASSVEEIEVGGDIATYVSSSDNAIDENSNAKSKLSASNDDVLAGENTGTVVQDNFYDFFDDSGVLKDTVTFDELIFQGEFSDLAAGYVIITQPIAITGDNAVLNNMGIVVSSNEVSLNNLALNANTALGDLIYVEGSNVNLTNLDITYIVDDEDARAISIIGATDVNVKNSNVAFESHVTSSTNDGCAINIDESENVVVTESVIDSSLPALYVDYMAVTTQFMGLDLVNPIRIVGSSNVKITRNVINSKTNDYSQEFATIQAMAILESNDCLVDSNNITLTDEFAQEGQDIYLYGISFAYDEGLVMSNNNFTVHTNGGKEAAGTAYAIQGIESELSIVGNNITTFSNGPNLGIYVTSMAGETSTMLIEKNFINVTGLAAEGNNWALVSGIEIQNGEAKIYNNTVYTYNVDEYNENDYLSGISYIQWMYGGRTFDIQDNFVYTEGKYAIYLLDASNSIITRNALYAHNLTGNDAVYIQSGENNIIEDNLHVDLTNIVTQDNFYSFFDENGMLLDTIEFDELIFQGEFSDLVDTIIISDEITLTSDNAILNNIALSIIGDDVTVTGFTLNENNANFTNNGGAAIYVSGSDVTLNNVSVTYVAPSETEAIAVFANSADNFALINSEIIYTGTNPGDKHNYGLKVKNSDEAIINNNTINAVLPAVPVSWGGTGIEQDLVLAVGIQGGDDVEFTNNIVTVNTNGGIGSYPTVDAVMIHSANDILIKGNNITHMDTTTEDGARYYYSLDIYSTTGTVEGNNIIVNTTAGVDRAGTAYPIQLTGPFTVTVKNNNLTAISKGPIAGIYASNWAGAATLTVEDNTIDVTGYATTGNYALVAGIEAEIDMLKVYNNTITVANGAAYDDSNQVIGVGIGSSYFYGDASADIKDNNITVDGKYAVYYIKAVNTNVTGNTLYGHELEGDDAAAIDAGENNVIKDNLPVVELTNIVTQDNFYSFFDEYGNLLDTVPFDDLIFQGEFSDLASYITIDRALTITGDNAVLNDIGFIIAGEGITLDNMTLVANSDLGNLIDIAGENAVIKNMNITYVASEAASAITVRPYTNDVQILNNSIYFESTVDDYAADEVTTAICVNSGVSLFDDEDPIEGLVIDGNNITAVIPAFLMDVYENEYYVMGLSAVNGVRINGADDFTFTNNNLDVTTNRLARTTPTLQALYVASSSGLIDGNNISMIDTFTPAGKDVYLYAIELIKDELLTISNNNFNLSTAGGKDEAGSAYAILAIASDFGVTGNNITTVSNGPNLGIWFPSNMGAPCDAVISGNFINVTGLATAAHNTGLVSGIEIQTGAVDIMDNTIYTYNIGEYEEGNYIYGISYAQDGRTSEVVITNNTVYTEGHYAISFLEVDDAEITGNYLVSTDLYGDGAVFIGEGTYNVENNLPTNVVTNDTFYNFFDENGILLDTIPFDELIFQGDFSNLTDMIVFNRPIVATGENAVLENIAIRIAADEVNLNGFTLNANKEFADNNGALIYATGSDIEIRDVVANYVAPSEAEAIAIYANAAENFVLFNSEIIYESTNPGSNHNYGLEVRNSNSALVDNVTIGAILPAVPVSWGGEGIGQDLVLAVGIQGGDDVEFTNNRVTVTTNGGIGSYPTVDAVMIHSANDISIKGNNITHIDTTTEDGARYYYALDLYSLTGTVEGNNIIVNTTAGVDRAGTAYPIQLNGASTVTVKDNNLTAVSKGPIAGIYATNWMGPITLIAENNNIDVTGYATTGNYALVSGIEAEIDVLKAYNNTIVVNNFADYDDVNQVYGISMTSLYMSGDAAADIKDNEITVDGMYAVYYVNAANTNVTGNTLYGHDLEGDDAAAIDAGENNVIKDNLPQPVYANISIEATGAWIGNDAAISVNVPNATGTVTIEINGKSYTVDLVDGVATKEIPAEDLVLGENAINVTYDGPEYASTTDTGALYVVDGVVTQETYLYYFNQADNGKLFDYIPDGATLDFQGSIINPDQAITVQMNVNKPVNIVSTTKDAYVDLNTTAASLLGESPGNSFAITYGGSGSNVTGINFHNTQLWFSNTHNVTLDNISNVVEDQRVGSGVGATSIRDNSTNVLLKNSYFYTRNNGGSTTFTMSWATNCTIDNCTVKAEGNVGNLIYLNIFNVANAPSGVPLNNYNTVSNNKIYGKEGSSISVGLMVEGQNNLIVNNTLYKSSISTSFGGVNPNNNTYVGNVLTDGGSLTAQPYSTIYGNNVTGALSTGKGSVAYDNVVGGKLTVGQDAIAYDNTVGNGLATGGTNAVIENNTITGAVTINKVETTFVGNNVTGTVTVSANNNVIKENTINTTGDYAVDLGSKTGNNVTDNYLVAALYKGDVAVKYSNADNIVENNTPVAPVVVDAEGAWIGNNATVTVTVANTTGTVTITVNGKNQTVELVDGVATIEVAAEDLELGENAVTVTYNGPEYAPVTVEDTIAVIDGVVTQETYMYYFNQADNGKLFDYIPDGATLDFQGSIINPDQANVVQMNVNKPVNIVSTTKDAYVDLNTTAGSLLGESPGNSFAITYGGSGTNVTGINFHNTQLWFSNTHNVVLDNISNVVEDQRVGSGVGATSIRDNSTNVLLKNSYFYTRNNGGSTTFTFSWANNCTIDNCTVKAEGNVGNLIYCNIFNVVGAPSGVPLNNYNTVSNNKIYGKEGSSISVGLMVEGSHNLIVNNTLYKSSISTSFGGVNPNNNTYVGNVLTDGGSLTAQSYSIVYGNNVTGALTTGKGSVAYDNVVGGKLTVSQDAIAYDNTVGAGLATGGTNAVIENNTITGAVTINKVGTTFVGNDVNGTVTVSANDNVIKGNNITTTSAYAVDLGSKTGNNVTDNYLIASELTGDAAVKYTNENNIVENNYPYDLNITFNEDFVMDYKDGSAWNITLLDATGNPIAGTTVKVGIAGHVYNRVTDADGVAKLTINLAPGVYDINATIESNGYYYDTFVNGTVTVNKGVAVLSASDLVMDYKDGSIWTVALTDANGDAISGVYIDANLSGKVYRIKTNASGIAKIAINLIPGTYDISASFANSKYEAETVNATITVNKATALLTGEDLVAEYGSGSSYSVTLTDADGNAIANSVVKITIGDKTYSRKTDANGVASLPINLAIGNYTVTAKFEGNSKYGEVEINNTIVVTKPELSIAAEDINMTYKDGTSYKVQLTDADGNPVAIAGEIVKVTIKGKTYERKTNASGIASLPINLGAGTWTITAEYDGKEITNTIVVNKDE